MTLHDPELVRRDYATEDGLAGRKAAYRYAEGPDARELAFAAVAEAAPRRVLEVGCGEGELAERIVHELQVELVALDLSPRMVELTQARGVDARVGNVEVLPFDDGEFDCVLAAWMLFHVATVDRALGELARVLVPNGRLVAVTNSTEHLRELVDLLGVERVEYSFSAETGAAQLRRHFSTVERRDAYGWIAFPSRAEAQDYVDHAIVWRGQQLPPFDGPLRVRRAPAVFVADK